MSNPKRLQDDALLAIGDLCENATMDDLAGANGKLKRYIATLEGLAASGGHRVQAILESMRASKKNIVQRQARRRRQLEGE